MPIGCGARIGRGLKGQARAWVGCAAIACSSRADEYAAEWLERVWAVNPVIACYRRFEACDGACLLFARQKPEGQHDGGRRTQRQVSAYWSKRQPEDAHALRPAF